MTGARHLLDARDLRAVCAALGVSLPLGAVLDVGCGTGRLAPLCQHYLGCDIAADQVAYAHTHGRSAVVIEGPSDLPDFVPDLITCISVFTHIDRPERQAYLRAFRVYDVPLLVDILPGDGSGAIAFWTARPEDMEADLREAGFRVCATADQAWDAHRHQYFYAEPVDPPGGPSWPAASM